MAAGDGKSVSFKFSTCLTKLASASIHQNSNPIRSHHWSQTGARLGTSMTRASLHFIPRFVHSSILFHSIPLPSVPFNRSFGRSSLIHFSFREHGFGQHTFVDLSFFRSTCTFEDRVLTKGSFLGGCTTTWGAFDVIMHPMRAICLAHAKRETLEPHWTENIPAGTPLHLDQFGFHVIGRHWEYSCPVVRHASRKHVQGWRLLWVSQLIKEIRQLDTTFLWNTLIPLAFCAADAPKKCWFPNGPKHGIRSEASRIKTTALSLENLISC